LILEPCHRADAEAHRLSDFDNIDSFGDLSSCLPQLVWLSTWSTEALSNLAMLRDEVALTFDLILGALQPSIDARADSRALELGKGTRDLEHEFARRGRGVDRLLIEVQIDATGLNVLDCAQ
jgi:hypothetical protein